MRYILSVSALGVLPTDCQNGTFGGEVGTLFQGTLAMGAVYIEGGISGEIP